MAEEVGGVANGERNWKGVQTKSGDGMLFELLDVALLDLVHKFFAAEEIIVEEAGELARDDDELVVSSFAEDTGPRAGIRWVPH